LSHHLSWDCTIYIDLGGIPVEKMNGFWNLSPEQIKATSTLKAVLAIPISAPNSPEELIGILSIDTLDGKNKPKLNDERVAEKALYIIANQLVGYIDEAAYSPNPKPDNPFWWVP
jgi:hypothetical protein